VIARACRRHLSHLRHVGLELRLRGFRFKVWGSDCRLEGFGGGACVSSLWGGYGQ